MSTIKFVLYAVIPALCHMDYNKYPIKYEKYFSFEMFYSSDINLEYIFAYPCSV